MKWLFHLGRYWMFVKDVFARPEKFSIYWKRFLRELDNYGYGSMGISALVSVFMGAVITIQTVYNLLNPLIPMSAVGIVARDSIILEFSPTMISLVLAGKIGYLASAVATADFAPADQHQEVYKVLKASLVSTKAEMNALVSGPLAAFMKELEANQVKPILSNWK